MFQRASCGSGGGRSFSPYLFTPSGVTEIDVGFIPKHIVLYVSLNGNATGLKVLWYDVDNDVLKFTVDGSFETSDTGYISVSGTKVTYTPAASSWYKPTRLFAF